MFFADRDAGSQVFGLLPAVVADRHAGSKVCWAAALCFLLTGMRVLKLWVAAFFLLAGVRVLMFLGYRLVFFTDRRAGSKVFEWTACVFLLTGVWVLKSLGFCLVFLVDRCALSKVAGLAPAVFC